MISLVAEAVKIFPKIVHLQMLPREAALVVWDSEDPAIEDSIEILEFTWHMASLHWPTAANLPTVYDFTSRGTATLVSSRRGAIWLCRRYLGIVAEDMGTAER